MKNICQSLSKSCNSTLKLDDFFKVVGPQDNKKKCGKFFKTTLEEGEFNRLKKGPNTAPLTLSVGERSLIAIILISLKGLKMENKLAVGTATVETTPTQNAVSTPAQKVVLMPITQSRVTRPVPGIRCLSATQIIIGSFLVVLGIIAAVLQARTSHSGNPIWTGLLVSRAYMSDFS